TVLPLRKPANGLRPSVFGSNHERDLAAAGHECCQNIFFVTVRVKDFHATTAKELSSFGYKLPESHLVFRQDLDLNTGTADLFGQASLVENDRQEGKLCPARERPQRSGHLRFGSRPAVAGSEMADARHSPL